LLNKCDLVGAERLRLLEEALRTVKPQARIVRTTQCRAALPLVLSVGLFQSDRFFADSGVVRACDLELDSSHESEQRHTGHQHATDTALCRAKISGFPRATPGECLPWQGPALDRRERLFHLVAKRFSLDEDARQDRARNKLVLIGRNLDCAVLRSQLETCLSPASEITTDPIRTLAVGL
jgi:G3E family GTPase